MVDHSNPTMKPFLFFIGLLILTGCKSNQTAPTAQLEPNVSAFPPPPVTLHDANPEPPMLVNLSVYRIAVPAKSISKNEEFWKPR